ncbi:MAG: hypothetical protein AWM53_00674 [Candidatus Dichloromethanomonas elyunquensis]|nr:MAG: hypothetical protein AWM53_00674 [Candidatus Dichloromethanomonas elyunquensis]
MRRMRDLVRLPVVSQNSGKKLGWVKDILFNEKNNRVTGIVLEKDSLLKCQLRNVARSDILSFGKESLLTDKLSRTKCSGTGWSEKVGSKVYNGDGDIKGTVGDIFVDNLVENVLGYEISDGLISDLFKGREAVFEENILAESQDVIVIEGGSLS